MFCEECGVKIEDGSKFCEQCGTPVTVQQEVAENSDDLLTSIRSDIIGWCITDCGYALDSAVGDEDNYWNIVIQDFNDTENICKFYDLQWNYYFAGYGVDQICDMIDRDGEGVYTSEKDYNTVVMNEAFTRMLEETINKNGEYTDVFGENAGRHIVEVCGLLEFIQAEENSDEIAGQDCFCTNCGAKLENDARFCEQCGMAVADFANSDGYDVFSCTDWKIRWRTIAEESQNPGIILTNTKDLLDHSKFKETLSAYTTFSKRRGVDYCFLDITTQKVMRNCDGNSVMQNVELLKKVYETACPKYLMIIGDEEVIGTIEWENKGRDNDKTVLSDLPYMTLDLSDPWQGQQYEFTQYVRVGRIPARANDNFQIAINYMKNAAKYTGLINSLKPFGLSALVWQRESDACFDKVEERQEVFCSPEIDLQKLNEKEIKGINNNISPNLLYFNLHGSDDTEYWYGQEGRNYPETMSPEIIGKLPKGYFLGVEACYGARYCGLEETDSILLTAMDKGCLAFLGSSKIAYGTAQEPGSCADIIVSEFMKNIKEGKSAGDAYIDALCSLTHDDMDNETIKTLAEFALYGDPAVSTQALQNNQQGLFFNVPVPDVLRQVQLVLEDVGNEIQEKLDSYVYNKYAYLKGVKPKVYKVTGKQVYQSVYEKYDGKICQLLKVYFEPNGKVVKEYIAK